MSLRKKPTMTQKKISAHKLKGRRSPGPATAEGASGFAPPTPATRKASPAGPSPYQRAAEIAPAPRNAQLMMTMEDSSFLQVWRVTNLSLKNKSQAREEEILEMPPRTREVYEKTAG